MEDSILQWLDYGNLDLSNSALCDSAASLKIELGMCLQRYLIQTCDQLSLFNCS